ncbi:protein of unknown function (plasmid) [Magnetospirillum sp. XM-1]|uniref:hypothetical protein n=1 Tax=Magnetospirillum sp. XM-1 TaxID=1663591 RepID=UPI00073DEC0F|nr:hypothetical protein [Magnetospirillum sp. XM-1]CUW41886.1 protein of unknown function [Magnetospirillum sp. XM-1]
MSSATIVKQQNDYYGTSYWTREDWRAVRGNNRLSIETPAGCEPPTRIRIQKSRDPLNGTAVEIEISKLESLRYIPSVDAMHASGEKPFTWTTCQDYHLFSYKPHSSSSTKIVICTTHGGGTRWLLVDETSGIGDRLSAIIAQLADADAWTLLHAIFETHEGSREAGRMTASREWAQAHVDGRIRKRNGRVWIESEHERKAKADRKAKDPILRQA